MSELRKIKLKIDTEILKDVVNKTEASLKEKAVPNVYALRTTECDYVISYKGVEFGVLKGELMYDNMHGRKVSEFVEKYIQEVLRRRGLRYRRVENNREVVFIL